MRLRWLNQRYAQLHGYFWLPCPVCGQRFGGHEWRREINKEFGRGYHITDIPTPGSGPTVGTGICPDCIAMGVGCRAWSDGSLPYRKAHLHCEFVPAPFETLFKEYDV